MYLYPYQYDIELVYTGSWHIQYGRLFDNHVLQIVWDSLRHRPCCCGSILFGDEYLAHVVLLLGSQVTGRAYHVPGVQEQPRSDWCDEQ